MFKYFLASIVRLFNAIVLSLITVGLLAFSVMIGLYSYNETTQDLDQKARGIANLASIALQNPIWNYDTPAQQDIVTAILGDKDVVGIEVQSTSDGSALVSELVGDFKGMEFKDVAERAQALDILINQGDVMMEGKAIAKVTIATSKAKAAQRIKLTSMLIGAFAASLVLIMGFLVWISARRIVARPLKTLEASAEHLAQGHLDHPIDTSRIDEIGSLAKRFADMRDAIKKKMEDLHLLNSTGEIMAGLHDQTEALRTALMVMKEQTNVSKGSIYLLMENKKDLIVSAFYPELTPANVSEIPKIFTVGEGIAGQAALQKKTIYVPDTSKDPSFVPLKEGESPRALLCVPMMDDQEVFGVMNFSGAVGQVTFTLDDEQFALTIARLTVVTTKNIQMLSVIEDQNRTLEQKVLERTTELRQKTNDINSMLQNMQQGIFTITADKTIHPEYSAYLERILEVDDIARQPFMDVLFSHTNIGADQLNQVQATVTSLLGEDEMMFSFNSHLLVNEFSKQLDGGRQKILEIDWAPICDDEGIIDKLMVTVRDTTELRGLQVEAEKQKQELEIIGQILSVNQSKFKEFLKTSHSFIRENENLITHNPDKDMDVLATLFRNMHTIKGNARTYGFKYLTDAVHEAEQTYDELRRAGMESQWDQTILLEELRQAEEYIDKYQSVYDSKLSGFSSVGGGKFMETALLTKIESELNATATPATASDSLARIRTLFDAMDSETIPSVLDSILKAVPALAQELGKEAPAIEIKDHDIRVMADISPILKDVFMHIFRNAMDHGFEVPAERLAHGKSPQGTLWLDVTKDDDRLTFRLRDDGRGLALGKLRQKGLDAGLLPVGELARDQDVAELIFHSGLSTAESVSEISGRGVGMDAVRRFLQKHGGSIRLNLLNDEATNGKDFRPFELVIDLPGNLGIQV